MIGEHPESLGKVGILGPGIKWEPPGQKSERPDGKYALPPYSFAEECDGYLYVITFATHAELMEHVAAATPNLRKGAAHPDSPRTVTKETPNA